MAAAEETAVRIGPRVRALRESMELSLRDLAERSGVSAPMLSQVERGETSPTLRSPPASPAAWISVSASCCASTRAAPSRSCAETERQRRAAATTGHRYEMLTPPLPGQRVELTRHTLAPGATHRRGGRPADPRARLARDRARRAGRVVLVIDGERRALERRRQRHVRRRPSASLREPGARPRARLPCRRRRRPPPRAGRLTRSATTQDA